MKRPYKEDTPINTIAKIRNILANVSLLPYEEVWYHPYNEIYSVRLQCPEDVSDFGANGKGRSRLYALASAYAEFIERLENGYLTGIYGLNRLFLKHVKKECGYFYFPDEKLVTKECFKKLPSYFLNDIMPNMSIEKQNDEIDMYFERLKENGQDGIVSVPFYSFLEKKIIYLPYNLLLTLTGSNGMAAGNTPSEGIFQALCELIERYAVSIIYYQRLTPPSVPIEILQNYPRELAIIKEIESFGYSLIVKDFSCGLSLPALGVVIMDKGKKKYRLNVGADTSFSTALSRALTEIHQGIKDELDFGKKMLDIPQEELPYFLNDTPDSLYRRSVEIRKFIVSGDGVFPKSLFGNEASYIMDLQAFGTQTTYADEVRYIIAKFIQQGVDVLIRDVSYLGFPAFYVYIPHISLLGRKSYKDASNSKSLTEAVRQDMIEDAFFPVSSSLFNKASIQSLYNVLIADKSIHIFGLKMKDLLRLDFNSYSYWNDLPASYFITLFAFIIGKYSDAQKYLKRFVKETNSEDNAYYKGVMNFFSYLEEEKSHEYIQTHVPKDILDDFSSIEKIYSEINLPNCPICSACGLQKVCLTTKNIELYKRLANAMKEHGLIDQNYLQMFSSNQNSTL